MNEHQRLGFREDTLRATAQAFPYPPTPDLAGAVQRRLARNTAPPPVRRVARRRVIWAGLALALLLAALLVAPRAEALVRAIFQIGGIQIVLVTPTPPPTAPVTPGPTPPPPAVLLDLMGATTLAAVQQGAMPVRLPTLPADLGPPDRVYSQDLDGPAVILVWLVPGHPDQVRLALYELSSALIGQKMISSTTLLQQTTVHDRPAVWIRGPHMLQIFQRGHPDMEAQQLVQGDVLAWEEGGVTYRLESTLTLDEARRVAESLAPAMTPQPTPTLLPTPTALRTPPAALSSLGGETTLAEARQRVIYPVLLPTTPADLGPPDHVYLQELGGRAGVILVWVVPGHADQVRLALYYIPEGVFAEKEITTAANVLQRTTVGSVPALWVQGPHMLRFADAQHPEWRAGRLIPGNVLVWAQSWLTVRLETTLALDEARRIAESLR